VESLYTRGEKAKLGGNAPTPSGKATMQQAAASLSAEQEASAQELAQQLSKAFAEELLGLARLLVSKDERHAFGQTEFEVRQVVHRLGAEALQAALAQKKTATAAPV
jgi:hypothetical protein